MYWMYWDDMLLRRVTSCFLFFGPARACLWDVLGVGESGGKSKLKLKSKWEVEAKLKRKLKLKI